MYKISLLLSAVASVTTRVVYNMNTINTPCSGLADIVRLPSARSLVQITATLFTLRRDWSEKIYIVHRFTMHLKDTKSKHLSLLEHLNCQYYLHHCYVQRQLYVNAWQSLCHLQDILRTQHGDIVKLAVCSRASYDVTETGFPTAAECLNVLLTWHGEPSRHPNNSCNSLSCLLLPFLQLAGLLVSRERKQQTYINWPVQAGVLKSSSGMLTS